MELERSLEGLGFHQRGWTGQLSFRVQTDSGSP